MPLLLHSILKIGSGAATWAGAAMVFALTVASASGAPAELPDIRRTPVVKAIERAMPSVVNIATEELVAIRDPFESMLREFFDPYHRQGPSGQRVNKNLGSGVIIDEDGFVLTNAHVTRRASRIWVKLANGIERECELVVSNPRSDVALLQIKADGKEKFTPIEFAENNDLLLGETVIALGNPFGLGGSVSQGILSSKNRRPPIEGEQLDIADWLQTDAAINPGNSGGPLVNLRGELIGMNVAIMPTGQGIGFAIPVTQISRGLSEALTPEGVRRMWFGARVSAGSPPIKVTKVEPESPAELAGLQVGDEILKVKGRTPRNFIHYSALLMRGKEIQDAPLKIRRDGKEMDLTVHLIPEGDYFNEKLILEMTGITIEALGSRSSSGIGPVQFIVKNVKEDSDAKKARIAPGQLLRGVNGAQFPDVVSLARALYSTPKDEDALLHMRYRRRRAFGFEYGDFDVELPIR
jgi:serine protease Do